MLYILSSGEEVINKSNKLVYCIQKESNIFKRHQWISGELTSSKVPTETPHVFHAETLWACCFHVVSTLFQ